MRLELTKRIFLTSLMLLLIGNTSVSAGVLGSIRDFILHKETLKWSAYVFGVVGSISDALRDSHTHKDHWKHEDHRKYLTGDGDVWHRIKNLDRIMYALMGASLAGSYAKDYNTGWELANRGLNIACISYLPWRSVYLKNKWDMWYSNEAKYNKNLIPYYIPFNKDDGFISMKGWQVDAFYTIITAFGATRAIFFDPAGRSKRDGYIPGNSEMVYTQRGWSGSSDRLLNPYNGQRQTRSLLLRGREAGESVYAWKGRKSVLGED